jgi:hypothetical protein
MRQRVYHRHYMTRDNAKQDIFEYIEVFYNRRRDTPPSAITPRPSLKRGPLWLNQVSTDLGEVHLILFSFFLS